MTNTGTFLLLGLAAATPTQAQSLETRVAAVRDGRVGLAFAARPDVCGYGTSYLRIGEGTFVGGGSYVSVDGDVGGMGPCEHGPVRVLVTRAQGETVALKVGVGGGPWPEGTTDLGSVASAPAAGFFLSLAERADGRLGREALVPAMLADSAEAWRGLLRIAQNRELSRGLRESATGWLGRETAWQDAADSRAITTGLTALAGDRNEPASLRTRAVSALSRVDGAGTAALITMADADDPVVARAALQALGHSDDPRAREVLRRKVREGSLPDGTRREAIRALGGSDAVPADYALLRDIWTTLPEGPARDAVLESLADGGGAENVRWLLGQVGTASLPVSDRANAARAAGRAGASTAELARLYDAGQDRRVKEALLDALLRIGDRAAVDKVTSIAESDTDLAIRRSAIQRLARLGDDKAMAVLKDMVEREKPD